MYDPVNNFNKYNRSAFYEISSIDSKFDTINKFHNNLLKLDKVKSKTDDTKHRKITVLRNVAELYNKWVDRYEKEYEQVFENKDENWRKKHDYNNLKDFGYQVDKVHKVNKADVTEKVGEDEDKTV